MIQEELQQQFLRNEHVKRLLPDIEKQVSEQTLPAASAVRRMIDSYQKS
jgi:hypothetical protein